MHLKFHNVNDAFHGLVRMFHNPLSEDINLVRKPSRYGDVLMIEEPVTITYRNPLEKVLFNAARNANPFFHLYESLWMLAGRNEVTPLAYYNKRMTEFSDNGMTFNGAYGYRWRNGWNDRHDFPKEVDQLKVIINHLKANPNSRRAVLQMWNVEDDLLNIDKSKDVCCNLSVCFSLREQLMTRHPKDPDDNPGWVQPVKYLDMTVFNRSNDMVWGMLGANAVHFAFLQEYVAAHLGAKVGKYNQISNNLHVYTANWKPEEWLAAYDGVKGNHDYDGYRAEGGIQLYQPFPLIKDPACFDEELPRFVELNADPSRRRVVQNWREPFLREVAARVCLAWHYRKDEPEIAQRYAEDIAADDWRIACTNWLQRRAAKKEVTK